MRAPGWTHSLTRRGSLSRFAILSPARPCCSRSLEDVTSVVVFCASHASAAASSVKPQDGDSSYSGQYHVSLKAASTSERWAGA